MQITRLPLLALADGTTGETTGPPCEWERAEPV